MSVTHLFGRLAPVVVNEHGGMQSKTAGAFYQLPGRAIHRLRTTFVSDATRGAHIDAAWDHIALLLEDNDSCDHLGQAFARLAWANEAGTDGVFVGPEASGGFPASALLIVAQVMEEGSQRYARGNWRKIPYESHINHAIQHMVAMAMGDESDDHMGHAITRLAFAIETENHEYRFTGIEDPKPKVVPMSHPREIVDVARNGTDVPPSFVQLTFEIGDVDSLSKTLEGLSNVAWSTLCEAMSFEFGRREPIAGNLGFSGGLDIDDC